jgi:H+/Cl- antiporter ClcA
MIPFWAALFCIFAAFLAGVFAGLYFATVKYFKIFLVELRERGVDKKIIQEAIDAVNFLR